MPIWLNAAQVVYSVNPNQLYWTSCLTPFSFSWLSCINSASADFSYKCWFIIIYKKTEKSGRGWQYFNWKILSMCYKMDVIYWLSCRLRGHNDICIYWYSEMLILMSENFKRCDFNILIFRHIRLSIASWCFLVTATLWYIDLSRFESIPKLLFDQNRVSFSYDLF